MGTVLPLFKEVQTEWQTFSDSIGKWVQAINKTVGKDLSHFHAAQSDYPLTIQPGLRVAVDFTREWA